MLNSTLIATERAILYSRKVPPPWELLQVPTSMLCRRSVRLRSTAAAPPCKSTSTPLLNIVLHEPQIPPNTGTAARSKLARGHPPLQKATRLLRAALAAVAADRSAYSTAFGRPGTIGRLALATRCRLHLVGRLGFSLDEKGFR